MQDIFIEYLVKRKSTPQIVFAKIGLVIAAVFVCLLLFLFGSALGPFAMMGPLLGIGAIYGAYYMVTSLNLEFEYAVTNGELDIDRIAAQRKRRRLVTVNCRQVEDFGKYKPEEHASKAYQTTILACDSPDSDDVWYCVAKIKDKGLTLIVFNANEKMLNGIKPFLPRPVMHAAFKVGAN